MFCESRALAQEWTYRFFGAALAHTDDVIGADMLRLAPPKSPQPLVSPDPVSPDLVVEPTASEVRAWAVSAGLDVGAKGRLRPEIWAAYPIATRPPPTQMP